VSVCSVFTLPCWSVACLHCRFGCNMFTLPCLYVTCLHCRVGL